MSSKLSFSLLLRPEPNELGRIARTIATKLFGIESSAWSTLSSTAEQDELGAGAARLRLPRPMPGTRANAGGELECEGRSLRFRLDEQPCLELEGLDDAALDQLWQLLVAWQAELLRAWVKAKGLSSLSPMALPRITQPAFAPEDFPLWLVRGELAALPRRVAAHGLAVASVAMAQEPNQRLLLRSVQIGEEQTVVPLCMLRTGARFFGGPLQARFASPSAITDALVKPLAQLLGVSIEIPKRSRENASSPALNYVSRWGELSQRSLRSFSESASVGRILRTEASMRVLEVRAEDPLPTGPNALFEVALDGLSERSQLFVIGTREAGSNDFALRAFGLAPPELIPEFERLLESALGR